MGKTAFALSLFTSIAEQNKKPIAFFSLEMPTNHLVNRMLSSRAQVDLEKIRSPKRLEKGEKERIALAHEELHNLPL
jgi:replicative DNA helicase